MAPPSWREAWAVLAVGWFTWALSVTAAASDAWFIGSDVKAGTLDFCTNIRANASSFEIKWCVLCECAVVANTCRRGNPSA